MIQWFRPYDGAGDNRLIFGLHATPASVVNDGAALVGTRDAFYRLVDDATGMSVEELNKLPRARLCNFLQNAVNVIFQRLLATC